MARHRIAKGLTVVAAFFGGVTVAFCAQSTTRPATQPATTQPTARKIESLVLQLRSRKFAERDAAQKALAELGQEAIPALIPLLSDPDPEVVSRVAQVIGNPTAPDQHVDVALRLINTLDPDWMERGVHMLFEDPQAYCDLFVSRAGTGDEPLSVVHKPVIERLLAAKRRHESFADRYRQWQKDKPEVVEKMRVMNKESDLYDAEAAYWAAHDALLEYQESKIGRPIIPRAVSSQPSR